MRKGRNWPHYGRRPEMRYVARQFRIGKPDLQEGIEARLDYYCDGDDDEDSDMEKKKKREKKGDWGRKKKEKRKVNIYCRKGALK